MITKGAKSPILNVRNGGVQRKQGLKMTKKLIAKSKVASEILHLPLNMKKIAENAIDSKNIHNMGKLHFLDHIGAY